MHSPMPANNPNRTCRSNWLHFSLPNRRVISARSTVISKRPLRRFTLKTIYSTRHALHSPRCELASGSLVEYHETPDRASYIVSAIRERGCGIIIKPRHFSLVPILATHDEAYVAFLRDAYPEWVEQWAKERNDAPEDAFAGSFNVQHPDSPPPQSIFGKLGFYTADGYVPITKTS